MSENKDKLENDKGGVRLNVGLGALTVHELKERWNTQSDAMNCPLG